MRIGIGIDGSTADKAVAGVRQAADAGFASAWFANIFGSDALTLCAVAGAAVDGIEIGTAVVPTYSRHPFAMAQQAATVNDACGGRLALGLGTSHQIVIETMWGLSFARAASHTEEYLRVVRSLLHDGSVSHQGEFFNVTGPLERATPEPPSILFAALGPRMLRIAGELTEGTVTWMTGPRTLADHVVPSLTKAFEDNGRSAPRVVCGLPVCLTDDVGAAREAAANTFAIYGGLPSYRAMLDREGAEGPADVAIAGDEATIRAELARLRDAGATEFSGAIYGEPDAMNRTYDLLADIAKSGI